MWPRRQPAEDRTAARGRHMPLERRRFPQPWDIEERNASCFIVMDANPLPGLLCLL